jgi:phenylalanine-4-hydroxylase
MAKAYPQFDPRTNAALPPDFVVPQRPADYTREDHETWRTLFHRQSELLHGRVVDEFFDGLDALNIASSGIPDFSDINRVLSQATGWTVVAVPGLVPDDVFFAHLAARRFPAGYWIRKPEQLDYIEEPDVFHDVFGHVPLLMQRRYADYMAAYGRAGLAYAGTPALVHLARLYWYTVEFGLMQTRAGLRIFGAGIISSAGEAVYSLESATPLRVRFDCERVLRTDYEIDDYQRIYFVLGGYDELPSLEIAELDRHVAAARNGATLAPGQSIDADEPVSPPRASSATKTAPLAGSTIA